MGTGSEKLTWEEWWRRWDGESIPALKIGLLQAVRALASKAPTDDEIAEQVSCLTRIGDESKPIEKNLEIRAEARKIFWRHVLPTCFHDSKRKNLEVFFPRSLSIVIEFLARSYENRPIFSELNGSQEGCVITLLERAWFLQNKFRLDGCGPLLAEPDKLMRATIHIAPNILDRLGKFEAIEPLYIFLMRDSGRGFKFSPEWRLGKESLRESMSELRDGRGHLVDEIPELIAACGHHKGQQADVLLHLLARAFATLS